MTIASTITDKTYTANGSTAQFSFPNKVFQASDLVVTLTDLVGNIYSFINFFNAATGLSYTVQNVDVDTGCFVNFSAQPTNGWTVDIRSLIPELQSTSVKNQGQFLPELHEEAFDRATRMIQDLLRLTYTYGIHGADIETTPWPPLPIASLRKGLVLMFDPTTGLPTVGIPTTVTLTQALLGLTFYPQTPAELALSVTPTNYWMPPYTVLRYVASIPLAINGTNDSTLALQTAINCAAQANFATASVGIPGALLKIGSAWTIDTNKTGFDGQGCYMNASGFTVGNWLTPIQSAADVNQRVLLNAAHPIRNFTVQGPGKQNTTAICIFLTDANVTPTIAGLLFQNLGLQDWGQDVIFSAGAFCCVFDQCTFAVTVAGSSGAATTYSIQTPIATNNAERNVFIGCGWYNKEFHIQSLATNSGDMYYIGCSFDGAKTVVSNTGSAYVYLTNCHIESGTGAVDLAPWIYVAGTNAGVFCDNCQFTVDANKPNLDLCWSDATCLNFGVHLTNCTLATQAGTWGGRVVGGPGASFVSNLRQLNGGAHPAIGQGMNLLAYGGFEQSAYANDWTFSGTTPPVRSSAQTHVLGPAWSGVTAYSVGNYVSSGGNYYYCIKANTNNVPPNATFWTLVGAVGTFSLSFPASSTNTPQAIATRACRPGQYMVGEFWYMVPAITGTGGTLYCEVDYLDQAGGSLGVGVVLGVTTNVAAMTFVSWKFNTPAPPGTVNCKLLFQIFGTSSGAPTAFIDDVILNVV